MLQIQSNFLLFLPTRDMSDSQQPRVGDTNHPILLSQKWYITKLFGAIERMCSVFSLSLTLDSANDKNYKLPYIYYDISALFVVYLLFFRFCFMSFSGQRHECNILLAEQNEINK